MKHLRKLLALIAVAAVLLSGCMWEPPVVKYGDMEYTRPDMSQFRTLLAECTALAEEGEDFKSFETVLWDFFACYNAFYTSYVLADTHYCADLTDIYWTEEYNYCLETASEVDAGVDQLNYTLAESVFREKLEEEEYFGAGYFDSYDGESLWDASFTALMEEEANLISGYYELSARMMDEAITAAEYEALVNQLCRLYAQLIAIRQEIAADAGYGSYAQFAYEFYYGRDYTPEQEAAYIDQIRQELVPLYRELCMYGVEGISVEACSETDALRYIRDCAEAMGGTVLEAFRLMEKAELYNIAPGAHKYDASFEVYIYDYYEPFVFMNPEGTDYDKLTLAHEFGHFCNDYASYGTGVGIDVAEIFSQGMAYLSLCYGADTSDLEILSMVDSLCVYVEQAAYASFEARAYELTGDELTAENLRALYAQVAEEFGFDIWGAVDTDFAGVTHFYTNPMYVFSYVVSNDAALQLYQLEREKAGAGLAKLEENLDTEEACFLAFLESADLESPFASGRIREVRETLEDILK